MTTRELAKLLGQSATLTLTGRDGLQGEIQVVILDARERFGRTDVLVASSGGDERWVSLERVTLGGTA